MDLNSGFLALITAARSNHSMIRVIEALVIAAVTAFALKYSSIDTLSAKIDSMDQKVEKLDMKVERMRVDLYEPRRR